MEGSWYKIKYNSGYGYVHKDYILVDGSSNNTTNGSTNNNSTNNGNNASNESNNSSENVINKTGYVYNVSSGGLNVRSAASTSSTILGTL